MCVGVDAGLRRMRVEGLRTSDLMMLSRSSLPGLSTRAEIAADAIRDYVAQSATALEGVTPQRWSPLREPLETARVA